MKTILLHVHDDIGTEARLTAALELARKHAAHLICVDCAPAVPSQAGSMRGSSYVMSDLDDIAARRQTRLEAQLALAGVAGVYRRTQGDTLPILLAKARLADIVVLARAVRATGPSGPLPLAGPVALGSRTPVLTVPSGMNTFKADGVAMLAWSGTTHSADALKRALPILRKAKQVVLAQVGEAESLLSAARAKEYLSRHRIPAEISPIARDGALTGMAILQAVDALAPDFVISACRASVRGGETVLCGETRQLLSDCPVPLLLAR